MLSRSYTTIDFENKPIKLSYCFVHFRVFIPVTGTGREGEGGRGPPFLRVSELP